MWDFKAKCTLQILALYVVSLPNYANQIDDHVNQDHQEPEYYFDENLAHGTFLSLQTLQRFNNQERILAGNYDLDVYLNNEFKKRFNQVPIQNFGHKSKACLTNEQLVSLGVKESVFLKLDNSDLKNCFALDARIKGAVQNLDVTQMRLYLTIAQNQLHFNPQGFVAEQDLNAGMRIGFANYSTNYYHVHNNGLVRQNYNSGYLSLSGGINFGLWQYRQNGYLNSSKQDNKQVTTWRNTRSYVQRPLLSLNSNLKIGQLATYGSLLSSLEFIGFDLSSDTRMHPDTKQGYAPEIHGIASTNAKVSVLQNGVEIYQTTVAPGGFVIDDLYPTNFQGDLEVIITEANGEIKRLSVPFAAVPTSMRPNMGIYNVAVGQTNLKNITKQAFFADFTQQYGLNNSITLNGGGRISDNYQAFLVGGVWGSNLGAIGADITYSNTKLPHNNYRDGYMGHLSYSKTLQRTNTTISLANYRYSSKSYYDLSNIVQLREDVKNGLAWSESSSQLQSRFDVSISQSLNKFGYIGIYALTNKYRDSRPKDKQWQLSYGNSFKGLGVSLSYVRQLNADYKPDNTFSLTLSLPLNIIKAYANTSYIKSSNSLAQYSANLSGTLDNELNASYGVGFSQIEQQDPNFNASYNQSLPKASLGVNGSIGKDYWQAGASLSGGVAVHSGGVTLGQYLGDTFALVEAPGATGAKVAYNSKIDAQGFALVSSLTPYRYNEINLDTYGMSYNAEVLEGSKKVAPYAGSVVKVDFATKVGYGVLIKATYDIRAPLPFGAEVFDEDNQLLGMVGQGGQIYLRLPKRSGKLKVKLTPNKSCLMIYDLPEPTTHDATNSLTKILANCI